MTAPYDVEEVGRQLWRWLTGNGAHDAEATAPSVVVGSEVPVYADLTVGPTSVTSATTIFSQNATGYEYVAVQVTSAGTTCTITYEQSNDNATWQSCAGQAINSFVASPVTTSTTTGIYAFPVTSQYFRARVSTYTSGTVTAIAYFRAAPVPLVGGIGVALGASTTGPMKAEDVASAGGDQGIAAMVIRKDTPVANALVSADADYTNLLVDNFGKLWTAETQAEDAVHTSGDRGAFTLGVRNDANATLTSADGDYSPMAVDLAGRTKIAEPSYSFNNITTNATTTVKSGAGILHSLVINTRGATTTATVYDNTAGSGTKIATIDTTLSTTSFLYDVAFATGLTIVTAGTTPADITVGYK